MVQLEIQGKNGRGVTRQVVISCKESDIDSSERLFQQSIHYSKVSGISPGLESERDKGLVLWVQEVSEEGWRRS